MNKLQQIAEEVKVCQRCMLHAKRTKTVPGWFPNDAKPILFITDGPNAAEDVSGKPLIGFHGTNFSQLVYETMDLIRDQYNITCCVKCQPVYNGRRIAPKRAALFWCAEYLYRQIELIKPKLIVSLGYIPFFTLVRRRTNDFAGLPKISLEQYIGKMYPLKGLPPICELEIPVYITYDPLAWNISKPIRQTARKNFEEIAEVFNAIESGEDISHLLRSRDEIQ